MLKLPPSDIFRPSNLENSVSIRLVPPASRFSWAPVRGSLSSALAGLHCVCAAETEEFKMGILLENALDWKTFLSASGWTSMSHNIQPRSSTPSVPLGLVVVSGDQSWGKVNIA